MTTSNGKDERISQAKKYLDEYDIENVVSEMLNSLLHEKDKNPYVYMIKYLASLLTEEELKEFGLVIPEPYPTAHPLVSFPKFSNDKNSLLKQFLTKEVFQPLKKIKTKLGNNLNSVTKPQLEDHIDCILSDGDTVNVYSPLLDPIISEVHRTKVEELKKFNLNFKPLNISNSYAEKEVSSHAEKIIFSYSRNLLDSPFNFYSCGPEKILAVATAIVNEVEGKIDKKFGTNFTVADYTENSPQLQKINYDFQWLDKAGLKQCWAAGRKIIFNEDNTIIILVNFANHLEIFSVWEKGSEKGIDYTFNILVELIKHLSIPLQFETHPTLGFLNTDIRLIGAGLKIQAELKLNKTKLSNGIDANDLVQKMLFDKASINENSILTTVETRKLCEIDDISFIEKYMNKLSGLSAVFNNEKEPKISFESLNIDRKDEIVESYKKTYEEIKYLLSAKGTNINNLMEKVIEENVFIVNDISEYITFYPFFREYLLQAQGFDISTTEHIHKLEQEKEMEEIELEDLKFITSIKITLCRNITTNSFSTSEDTNDKVEAQIKTILDEINSRGHFAEYIPIEEEKAQNILKENEIETTTKGPIAKGGVIAFEKEGVYGVVNDYDNMKFYLRINDPKVKMSSLFVGFLKVLNEISRHAQFLYDNHLGFITAFPNYLGTGMKVEVKMKTEKATSEDIKEILNESEFDFKTEDEQKTAVIWNRVTIGETETEIMRNLLSKIQLIVNKAK